MYDLLMLNIDEEWRETPACTAGSSIFSPIGIVEGEVLSYLEEHGASSLKELDLALGIPILMVTMGTGALIRAGLVRGVQSAEGIVLELCSNRLSRANA
jgi:hypothetical protein